MDIEVANYVKGFYDQAMQRPFGVNDVRVKLLDLSLGVWVYRAAGILPGLEGHNPEGAANFREYYSRCMTGRPDKETRQKFEAEYEKIRDYVIETAHVIVTTCTNSGAPTLRRHFKPDLVVVDEAGKAMDADVIVPMAFYLPRVLVLVGDERQLRPTVISRRFENCFAEQLSYSLMARLKKLGALTAFLSEQHRMTAGLVELPSQLFYNGRLKDDLTSTAIQGRPRAQWFVDFAHRRLGLRRNDVPRVFVDLDESECERKGESKYNKHHAGYLLNLVELMLEDGARPDEIAVATFYQAQYDLYRAAFRTMQLRHPMRDL
jgi:superfamily I DNA and/or RNA helicase